MRARSTLSEQQRERLVDLFEQGLGYKAASTELRVKSEPVRRLYRSWHLHGRLCLMEKRTKSVYSFEIKKEIVDRHATGETRMDLAKEFNLSSQKLVGKWAKQHREGGDEALMLKPKGRPTTGVIRRLKTPGVRRAQYEWSDDAWVNCAKHTRDQVAKLQDLAERTATTSDGSELFLSRIRDMEKYYHLMTDGLARLSDEYETQFRAEQPTEISATTKTMRT